MNEIDARVAEIAARAEKATPGPWRTEHVYGLVSPTQIDGFAFPKLRAEEQARISADTEFVAAARTDIPFLLSEVRRLRSVVEDAEKVIAGSRRLLESWPETMVYKVRDLLDTYDCTCVGNPRCPMNERPSDD